MRPSFILLLTIGLFSCKNNGQGSSSAKSAEAPTVKKNSTKEIIVDAAKASALAEPDFSVLTWETRKDILEVVVRYSGGCKEHDFNAYFSGAWLKSFPPQAIIGIEHVNPDKDPCRSLVVDTLKFNLSNIKYNGGKEVVLKWSGDAEKWAKYKYAE